MTIDINQLTNNLLTQDNAWTADPLFIVQQKRQIWGIDESYDPKIAWRCDDAVYTEGSREFRILQKMEDRGKEIEGYEKVGYIEIWEFVTACLTEQGCKDYLAVNGHNLHSPRIYVSSAYRNREIIGLREYFIKGASESKS